MISKFLKSKNIIEMINPLIDEKELLGNANYCNYYLNCNNHDGKVYHYYDGLFEDFELDRIISICDRLPQTEGYLNSDKKVDFDIRISKVSWIPINAVTEWIYQRLTNCVLEVNSQFFNFDLDLIQNLQFTRYYGNSKGFYGKHLDSMNWNLPVDRKLSFVLQLSDPSEYEGGELRLHLSDNADVVHKKKGLITFFPSSVLHECTPVLEGERYVIVGWVSGPQFR